MAAVNVYTEWGPLREIIVGNCVLSTRVNVDLSFRLLYRAQLQDAILANCYELQERMIEQRQEDLDGLQDTLEKLGVRVRRPARLTEVRNFSTPWFSGITTASQNPRDQVLIAGDEIIETSCVNSTRFFENDLLKDIFYEYFHAGSRWTCAPRPTMKPESFDTRGGDTGSKDAGSACPKSDASFEMMFDAAQCLKFGRDIIMNVSNANHELGAKWLQKHLEGRFRIHTVKITDYHIDGMFMPLRPGVLLINPLTMYNKLHLLPKSLQKWDVLMVPEADRTPYPAGSVLLASSNINVNVLPIDENRVIVFSPDITRPNPLMKVLEKRGFTAIPVRLRHSRVFDGGVHCATLDTIREDKPEDYLD